MALPVIRVEDNSATPALTLRYICGGNELDVVAIYANIHRLLEHPGRAHYDQTSLEQAMTACSNTFLDAFWAAAASLLDYFADFFATDTALMQSIWFHLLDTWQKASPQHVYDQGLPCQLPPNAQLFKQDYNDTLELFHTLLHTQARGHPDAYAESIIHDPTGAVDGPTGIHTVGPYVSGLKPWQQFLCAGSPGFAPSVAAAGQVSADADTDPSTRYLPHAAIALIHAHTARARSLTHKHFMRTSTSNNNSTLTTALTTFTTQSIHPPTPSQPSTTHPSLLRPHTLLTLRLQRGAPPVRRYEGLADPSMLVSAPGLVLVDEAVGSCRGREAYGAVGEGGWDVWGVGEGRGGAEGCDGGGGGKGGERGVGEGWGEMFDEWCVGG